MNGKLKTTATAFLLAAMIPTVTVEASGIPTFDGAAAANALQQLMNWQQNFGNMIREKLQQITGIDKLIEARQTAAINQMFERRKAKCNKMTASNPTSATLCLNTVILEQKKYNLLVQMDKEISSEFAKTNSIISSQNKNATSIGGILGFADSSGKAQSNEQAAQIQLQVVQAKYNQYKNQLDSIDSLIAQYKRMRVDLTKEQLGGSNLGNTISKAAATATLQTNASDYRNKAAALRQRSAGISNRF